MRSSPLMAVLALALPGCAHQQTMWAKDGATPDQFERDKAQCIYEASAATQQTTPGYRTAFGQELDRAMRRNELAVLCMKARGYSQQVVPGGAGAGTTSLPP